MSILCLHRSRRRTVPAAKRFAWPLLVMLAGAALFRGSALAAVFDFTPESGAIVEAAYFQANNRVTMRIAGVTETNVTSGLTEDLKVNNGIVAWSSGGTVYSYVFDPARGRWIGQSSSHATTTISDLRLADGVVAWSVVGGDVFFRVYDPAKGSWVQQQGPGPMTGPEVLNRHGVVAWNTSTMVHYRTYDPTRAGGWMPGSMTASGGVFDLQTKDGVVAWSKDPAVEYRVYDPATGFWKNGSVPNSGYTTDLAITNSRVTWTSSTSYSRGYNPNTGIWQDAPVPLAYLAVSTNAGNAPLEVAFIDLSIGATSWSLNFGDGSPAVPKRAGLHRYNSFGRFTASQIVGGSTSSRVILTDISPPTGAVQINNGASFTTNRNVTLNLTATDNSQLPVLMRLSNEGTNWTDWTTFAASTPWSLATNNGSRTVSVQFRDVALNTSATVSASIQLDTSPLPTVRLVNTNLAEADSAYTMLVTLDRSYSRAVAVTYIATNGTATAGVDYLATSGTLVFSPGVTSLTFPLTVKGDAQVELNETILVTFNVLSNAIAGPPGVITILDDDDPTVSFAQTNYTLVENGGPAAIAVRLSAPSGKTVFVQYAATNGTATADVDYAPVQGVLAFPPGVTNLAFAIPVADDSTDELSETIQLRLIAATNALMIAPTNAFLTIIDDDNPLVYFSSQTYLVTEDAGFVEVRVWLSKPFSQPVRVRYATSGGTAVPGLGNDYLAVSADLEFSTDASSEESTNQFFFVNLVNDGVAEPIETVHLRLSNFRNATPGPRTEADIVIIDDDGPPQMTFPLLTTGGQFQFTLQGKAGQRFDIEYSTNLLNWIHLTTLINETGTMTFTQPVNTNSPGRFYRTRFIR